MAEPVTSIDALRRATGLEADAWEVELLKAADAAGNSDGQLTVAELDAYVEAPRDGRFVSAGAVRRMRAELLAPGRVGLQVRSVSSFPESWQRTIAERADARSNGDGALSEIELDEELFRGNSDSAHTRRVSEQALAMWRSRIAAGTGEADLLRVTDTNGATPSGLELLQRYARISYHPQQRIPRVVSYVLSAADLREQVIRRDGDYRTDTALPRDAQARPADYEGSGLDVGHLRPAGDSATTDAMRESMLMSNMAPEEPNLNRHVWAQLEDAVRDVVRITDGRATVFTGTLFLNERGEPTRPTRWITRTLRGQEQQRVAVPTHLFKVVLIEQPNRAMTLVGFVVPNRNDVPTTRDAMRPFLHASRRSVEDIQRLAGVDLLRDLPDDVERPMEASPDACIALPAGTQLEAVSLLWPSNCRPQSWTPGAPTTATPAPMPPVADNGNALVRFLNRLKFW